MVCVHTARRCPTLWHTPVRLCPWKDGNMCISQTVPDVRPLSYEAEPSKLEEGTRNSVSQISSSQPSSRGSSQTLSNLDPSPRLTSQFPRALPRPPVPRCVPSQLPAIRAHLSHPRMVSQPPPSRLSLQQPSRVRTMSSLSPSRIPSRPVPSQHAATRCPSRPGSTWPVTPNYYLYNAEGR